MRGIFLLLTAALCVIGMSGCAHLKEIPKKIWGSSTQALEEARIDSVHRLYENRLNDCLDKVLEIAKEKELTVFLEDRRRSLIVLMGIPGSINTTEVGVFFMGFGENTTKVEISSLSLAARDKLAEILFSGLKKTLKEIK